MICVFLQEGWTALHYAAGGGNTEVVQLLLSCHPGLLAQANNVSKQIIQFSIFIHHHT